MAAGGTRGPAERREARGEGAPDRRRAAARGRPWRVLLSCSLIPPLTWPEGSLPFPAWSVLLTLILAPHPANTEFRQGALGTARSEHWVSGPLRRESLYRPPGTGAALREGPRGEAARGDGGGKAGGERDCERGQAACSCWPGGVTSLGVSYHGPCAARRMRRLCCASSQASVRERQPTGSASAQERERYIWLWLQGTESVQWVHS